MKRLFPGAILGLALVLVTSGMARPVVNGYVAKRAVKHTAEPLSTFYECFLFPWLPWCQRPADPKVLQPDVPAGCCTAGCWGPCPQ